MLTRSRSWRSTAWCLISMILFSLAGGGSFASAQTPVAGDELQMIGQVGGVTRAVAAQDGYVYVASGSRLLIQQVTANGMALTIGSSQPFSHFALGVAVDGRYAYVAAGSAGLRLLDVSDPEHPTEVGAWDSPGYAESVAIDGDMAYVADGPYGLQIVDVADRAKPKCLGSAFTTNYAFDVAVDAGQAYVASAGAGLLIADVTDPRKPVELAALDTPGYAYGVAARGGMAYVADGWEGLQVVDATAPRQPRIAGRCNPTGWIFDVTVSEQGYAYLAAAYGGIRVVDVSSPATPREVAAVEVAELAPQPGEQEKAPGNVGGIALDGEWLYAAEHESGLLTVNVADPTRPRRLGTTPPTDVAGLACEGAVVRLYGLGVISGRPDGTYGPQLTVTRAELAKMLVTAIGAPIPAGAAATAFTDVPGTHWAAPYVAAATAAGIINGYPDGTFKPSRVVSGAEAITMSLRAIRQRPRNGVTLDDYVSLAAELGMSAGIGINPAVGLDRGKTALLIDRMFYDTPDGVNGRTLAESRHALTVEGRLGWADSVAVKGQYAYIACGAFGLAVVDLADPSRPVQVASSAISSFSTAVAVVGDYAYVAANSGSEGGLLVYDIRHPTRPQRVCLYQSHEIGAYQDLTIVGDRAYLADERGLEILTLSDPARPRRLGRIDLWDSQKYSTTGVAVKGNYAYVVANAGGLFVINVADPSSPKLVARYSGESYGPTRISLAGNLAYLLGTWRVEAVDISDPANPKLAAGLRLPNESFGGVKATADGIYLAGGIKGLTLVRNDGKTLTPLASLNTPGSALDVAVDGNLVLVADAHDGLLVLRKGNTVSDAGQVRAIAECGTGTVTEEMQPPKDSGPITTAVTDGTAVMADLYNPAARPEITRRVVTSKADKGTGTLRSCLKNAKPGLYITFDPAVFPRGNPSVIAVESALPELRCGFVTIDGQGAGVIIDGGKLRANGQFPQSGLTASSEGNVIKGLEIRNFPDHGIFLANGWRNIVGGYRPGEGNVLYGNGWHGICMLMPGAFGNIIVGNYCGTDRTGTAGPGNRGHGISMEMGAWGNLIQGNLCSGNDRVGISIGDDGSSFNTIVGNIVGTDVTGTKALPNDGAGICASYFGASFNRIGGTAPGEGNLISGNRTGLTMGGPGSEGILVLGNRFGTTADGTGTVALSGYQCSVEVGSVMHTMVGGFTPAEGNIIDAGGDGVTLYSDFNFVLGNRMRLGTYEEPAGVAVFTDGEHNWVQGNTIGGVLGSGVEVDTGGGNTVRRNLISGCRLEPIDFSNGANGGAEAPVIAQVAANTVSGTAQPLALIEVYSYSADGTAFFEGETVADAGGRFSFQADAAFHGAKVWCTATDTDGNTSPGAER